MITDTAKTNREVFVEDCLQNFQKQGAAAFGDGDFEFNVFWPTGSRAKKYQIVQTTSGETWVLKFSHDLSVNGWHNCMWHWLNNDGTWPDMVKFNALAEEHRAAYVAEQHAIRDARLAREAREQAEQDERSRRYSEHRATLDTLVANAKFKKQEIDLAMSKEASIEGLSNRVSAWTYKGLAIHKEAVANPKRARFVLTHIGSGLNLGFKFNSLLGAKTAVVRFVDAIVGGDFARLSPQEILANDSVCKLAQLIQAKKQLDSHDPYVMAEIERG